MPMKPDRNFPGRPARRCVAALVVCSILAGCGDDPLATGLSCSEYPPLQAGTPREGVLSTSDPLLENAHIDYYGLLISEPGTLRVTMASQELDPFILLFDARARPLAQAYSATPGNQAVLTTGLGAGCFLIGATSWDQRARGRYTITAEILGP